MALCRGGGRCNCHFVGVDFGQFALGPKAHADFLAGKSVVDFDPMSTIREHEKSSARLVFELLNDFFGQPSFPIPIQRIVSISAIFNHLTKSQISQVVLYKLSPSK